MAGAYCKFCGRRCFVYRQVIVGGEIVWSGHLATCAEGKAWDRSKIGQDADTAHNPAAPPGHCVRCGVAYETPTRPQCECAGEPPLVGAGVPGREHIAYRNRVQQLRHKPDRVAR